MYRKIVNWVKYKYYDWVIDKELSSGSGISDNKVNLFGELSGESLNTKSEQVEQDQQRKYQEGVGLIKSKLKKQVEAKGGINSFNFDSVLSQFKSDLSAEQWAEDLMQDDLFDLSEGEKSEILQTIKDMVVYREADIKTDKDKIDMVLGRIQDYKKLQVKRQIRSINRDLRKAEQEGRKEEAKELWSKINELSRTI